MQFNHFLNLSLWEFSMAMATKPRGRLAGIELHSIALTHLTFVPNKSPMLQWLCSGSHYFFLIYLMLPWKPNKMATGHEAHKLGRQSSNDHDCQIWFTSHHFTGYEVNAI